MIATSSMHEKITVLTMLMMMVRADDECQDGNDYNGLKFLPGRNISE